MNALTKWKTSRSGDRLSKTSIDYGDFTTPICDSEPIPTTPLPSLGRLPTEIYEQIFNHIGSDIPLLPEGYDGIHTLNQYYSYFESVHEGIQARNRTLANCCLVSSTWNQLSSAQLNRYLIFRNNRWKDHTIWRHETFRRQVRHVWITPQAVNEDIFFNPSHGIFALILTGFPNLESLHASFPGCYEAFYCAQFLRLHVPRNLRILGINGPVSGSFLNPSHIRAELQINILRLFPKLETFLEVEGTPHLFELEERVVLAFIGCSIKMKFAPVIEPAYFSHLRTLSLTGGHILQDDKIISFVALCPPIKHLRIRGFDSSFTMNGTAPLTRLTEQVWNVFSRKLGRIFNPSTSQSDKAIPFGAMDQDIYVPFSRGHVPTSVSSGLARRIVLLNRFGVRVVVASCSNWLLGRIWSIVICACIRDGVGV